METWLLKCFPDFDFEEFSEPKSDIDRAAYIMDMINKYDPVAFDCQSRKNEVLSVENSISGDYLCEKEDFHSALYYYNRACALAPTNSEQYLKSVVKRANCCLALKDIEGAFSGLQLALKCTTIEPDYRKELKRQRKHLGKVLAKKLRSSAPSSHQNEPVLPSQNEYLTCASKKVALSSNEHVGRLLKVTADASVGEILLIEEPYARILSPKFHMTSCWNCHSYNKCLLPCTGCSHAVFCGKQCIEEAKMYHDFECSILDLLLDGLGVGKSELLAFRMFLIAIEQGNKLNELHKKVSNINTELENSETYDSHDFNRVYDLTNHAGEETNVDIFIEAFIAGFIVSALKKYTKLFEDAHDLQVFACSLLLRFLLIADFNKQNIATLNGGSNFDVAVAVYPTYSLVNHSCDPNVVRHFYKNRLILRAIKSIKAGEELLVCYGCHYGFFSLEERRNLFQHHHFTCTCKPCMENWPLYSNLPAGEPILMAPNEDIKCRLKEFSFTFNELFEFEKKGRTIEVTNCAPFSYHLEFLCTYVEFLDKHIKMPWKEYVDCQEAIKHGLKSIPFFTR